MKITTINSLSKQAQQLQFVKPMNKLTKREILRSLRDAIINEQIAVQQYEQIVDSIDNRKIKSILQDIADEEKVHIGELTEALSFIDKSEDGFLEEGREEAKVITASANYNDSKLKDIRKVIKNRDSSWGYVTPEELKAEGLSKYFIIDLRDEDSFKQGHVKNATNIFWKDILDDNNLKKLPKNKTLLLVCYVGHTASQVLTALSFLGYKAKVLKFGMGISPVKGVPVAGWTDFGFKVVKEN